MQLLHTYEEDPGDEANIRIGCTHFEIFPLLPSLPMVRCDGMDSMDEGMGSGRVWDVPTVSVPLRKMSRIAYRHPTVLGPLYSYERLH